MPARALDGISITMQSKNAKSLYPKGDILLVKHCSQINLSSANWQSTADNNKPDYFCKEKEAIFLSAFA
jgi:hypothetical protein